MSYSSFLLRLLDARGYIHQATDAAALDALRKFIANPDPPDVAVPRTVIRVVATSADKVMAETLVELATNPRANKLIVSAAADALPADWTQRQTLRATAGALALAALGLWLLGRVGRAARTGRA